MLKPYSCIIIDPADGPAVKLQIQRYVEYMIAIGAYRAGERLPTSADLGRQLGVNDHTVRAAYDVLRDAGTIVTATKSGSAVAPDALTPELLRSVARFAVSPAIGTAKSIGCSRGDVVDVINELLDQWFSRRSKKR